MERSVRMNLFLVFFLNYDQEIMHAVNGIGFGVVVVQFNSNFVVKIYDQSESYKEVSAALLEIVSLF